MTNSTRTSGDIDITRGLVATLEATSDRDLHRDAGGRLPGAPAWSGDVTKLPDDLLHGRIEALGAHIGRLFTRYNVMDRSWSAVTPDSADLDRWIAARIAALTESERRRGVAHA